MTLGYMRHHAILVSGSDMNDQVEQAHQRAADLGMAVTPIVDSDVNGIRTFAVVPDGSKEWWDTSDRGDAARDALVASLRDLDRLRWCEVQYGDDDSHNRVLRTDDDDI